MEAHAITIHWHNDNQPIYSIDYQPNSQDFKRLITGGGDNNIRIWKFLENDSIEYLSTLSKHTQAVNVVRFNPQANIIASAGDDGTILLWIKSDTIIKDLESSDQQFEDLESWKVVTSLRSSTSEIMDICWSNNGEYLISGSMDNILRVYKIEEKNGVWSGDLINSFNNHSHYVQGVYYDPIDEFIVSQSADRSVNIYKDFQLYAKFQKFNNLNLYHSETLQSFFRRLCFSPDGSLLLTPAGLENTDNEKESNVVYIYSRGSLGKSPIMKLSGFNKPTIVISFNERKFKGGSVLDLPYYYIFAIATQESILLYSTKDFKILASVSNLHYSSITALKWIEYNKLLISSTDGFCSIVKINDDLFGEIYTE
ncbi:unnamed protein product [Candida verbasci]|uniref:CAF1B/HIR1 beta-propeller domain-containing protein n=1 Tax=Candida verbasci TaxID=1227364 RepID=A0A9W4XIE6_9ASCO|nr:unnamed protein product [Candida verbasci]